MNTEKFAKDRHGSIVREGDIVRVLIVDLGTIKNLSDKEQEDVRLMIGKEYKVEEIDEYGCAWITHWWDRGEGRTESHSLALEGDEMEKVGDGG